MLGILINPAMSMNETNNDELNINNQSSFTNNTFSDTNNNSDSIINNYNNSKKVKSYIQKLQEKDIYSSIMDGNFTSEQFKQYLNAIYSYYEKNGNKEYFAIYSDNAIHGDYTEYVDIKQKFCLFDMSKFDLGDTERFDKFYEWFNEVYDYFKNKIFDNPDLKDVIKNKFVMYYKNEFGIDTVCESLDLIKEQVEASRAMMNEFRGIRMANNGK